MEKVKEYGGAATTTGATAYLLTKLLSNSDSNKTTYGGMSIASTVGVAAAVGSVSSKLAHDYVLPHIPQSEKWQTVEAAAINATASGAGSVGYVYLMDPSLARADALQISLYSIGGEMLGNYIFDHFVKPSMGGFYSM